MSLSIKDYRICKNNFKIKNTIQISTDSVLKAIIDTNNYLDSLNQECKKLNINFFHALGQRNLSGFIGEVYKSFLDDTLKIIKMNPHPDGRPDLIFYNNIEYYNSGFKRINEKLMPNKKFFTPYKYGGIEIKCTIGSHSISKKEKTERNHKPFEIYESRIEFLKGITYMAHHAHNINLLGLYYDYYEDSDLCPQILTGFYSDIVEADWGRISKPKVNTKTTSAGSISKSGIEKLKQNCLFHIRNKKYVSKFNEIGFNLNM